MLTHKTEGSKTGILIRPTHCTKSLTLFDLASISFHGDPSDQVSMSKCQQHDHCWQLLLPDPHNAESHDTQ